MYFESERRREDARKKLARVKRALKLTGQPTTLRQCLKCVYLMRSTGPDHRICNPCKGENIYQFVGSRLKD